jgi:uncharacterized protein (TIGR02466 family)|tara:strand:- start:782 stop:1360 length:579 start_codon:yes stop_codon:yes gene_type:complete
MGSKYVNFGPFVYCGEIDDLTVKAVLALCKKNKKQNANHQLAGHLDNQFNINFNKYMDLIAPWVKEYILEAEKFYNGHVANAVKIKSAWVNYMKPGDFNPPHVHTDCHLSSVLFLRTPDLTKEKEKYKGTHHGPGTLEFLYGEERLLNNAHYCVTPRRGDLYIFPANVRHFVSPFKTKGERISVAANFLIQK